jgi:CheY-like chemotaxis protein
MWGESMSAVRILIVEDESIVAKDVQKTLQGMGYDVPAISLSAEDALVKVQENRPDLVIMDIILSGEMNGIEAANLIRERHNIPVLFLTAYMDDKIRKAARITETFEYVIKPLDERELRDSVEKAIARAGSIS